MIKDLLINNFKSRSGLDLFTGIVMWIFFLLLIVLVFGGLFLFFDSTGKTLIQTEGKIVQKKYEPAYSVTTYVKSGNVMIPVQNFIPEIYKLYIQIGPCQDYLEVPADFYNKVCTGETICCQY